MATQRAPRARNWLWFGLTALIVGMLVFALGRGAGVPRADAVVFYPAVMLYNYGVIQLAILLLLAVALLAVLWLPQAVRRGPHFAWNGLALGLALVGAGLTCWGSLPRALSLNNYVHLHRAELAGRVYQLGARVALDGDNYYMLCDCARPGWVCRCRPLREAGAPTFAERPVLVADPAARSLSIRVGEQTVWTLVP